MAARHHAIWRPVRLSPPPTGGVEVRPVAARLSRRSLYSGRSRARPPRAAHHEPHAFRISSFPWGHPSVTFSQFSRSRRRQDRSLHHPPCGSSPAGDAAPERRPCLPPFRCRAVLRVRRRCFVGAALQRAGPPRSAARTGAAMHSAAAVGMLGFFAPSVSPSGGAPVRAKAAGQSGIEEGVA